MRLTPTAALLACGGFVGCQTADEHLSDYGRPISLEVLSPSFAQYNGDLKAPGSPYGPAAAKVAIMETRPAGGVTTNKQDFSVVPASFSALPADDKAKPQPDPHIDLPDLLAHPLVPSLAERPIDLTTALSLAGAGNPTIALAEEAVRASQAAQLTARAMLLPDLTAGLNYHLHQGVLQAETGQIRDVNSQAFYIGSGAEAIGSGTVAVPGVRILAHLGDAVFEPRAAAQRLLGRQFAAVATRNTILLDVVDRYFALIEAEQRRRALHQSERDIGEIVRLTANFAEAGQGREGDAERARADALIFHGEAEQAEEDVAVASADLAELLGIDPSSLLRSANDLLAPIQLIPPTAELSGLVQTSLRNRPELGAAAAAVAENQTRVRQERVRPLLPVVSLGFSAGTFGGGSNLVAQRFGQFNGRMDFDASAVWTLQNAGMGNVVRTRRRRAELGESLAEQQRVLDQIAREVAEAHALLQVRRSEMDAAERRIKIAEEGFRLDLERAKNLNGLPIELLNSARQVSDARQEIIRAIVGFNQSQFRLFVAIGQPPFVIQPPANR